jgi:hypothetical protein
MPPVEGGQPAESALVASLPKNVDILTGSA